MGIPLTDLLVDLSSPKIRAEYDRDPIKFLSSRGLSAVELDAVATLNLALIWQHAKSIDTDDSTQQFNRLSRPTADTLIEIHPVVELHQEINHQTATFPGTEQIMIGEDGRLYRLDPA